MGDNFAALADLEVQVFASKLSNRKHKRPNLPRTTTRFVKRTELHGLNGRTQERLELLLAYGAEQALARMSG